MEQLVSGKRNATKISEDEMAEFKVSVNEKEFDIDLVTTHTATVNETEYTIDLHRIGIDQYSIIMNNQVFEINIKGDGLNQFEAECFNNNFKITVADEKDQLLKRFSQLSEATHKIISIAAPMPGLVLKVEVEVGQQINPGTGLIILEAMKMENEIRSTVSGVVKEIKVKEKTPVEKGEILLILE